MGCLSSKDEQNLSVIWILGGLGSGKLTQCKRIFLKYGYAHLCVGDLLRDEVVSGSAVGMRISEKIKNKQLVENDVVLKMISDAMLKKLASSERFVINGCPRNKEQALAFEIQLLPCTMIIYFREPHDAMVNRILTRGESLGMCNESLEVIKFRMQNFLKNNDEIIRCYPSKLKRSHRAEYDMNPVKNTPVIFVSGVPGAGSQTASETLSQLTGYRVINPGDLIRMEATKHTTLRGTSLAKMLEQKMTIPEETILDLVKEDMLENADSKGFIICGFPKTRRMMSLYKSEVKTPDRLLSLQVADEVAVKRLQSKLAEVGRPSIEIQHAQNLVKTAVPRVKMIKEKFTVGSVVTVNSSFGNLEALQDTIREASDSFKDLLKTPENMYLLNLPDSSTATSLSTE